MVIANKNLLKEVSRLAIRDELLAMRLRGRLVAIPVGSQRAEQPDEQPVKKPDRKR